MTFQESKDAQCTYISVIDIGVGVLDEIKDKIYSRARVCKRIVELTMVRYLSNRSSELVQFTLQIPSMRKIVDLKRINPRISLVEFEAQSRY